MENQKLDALCEAFFTEHQVRAMDVAIFQQGSEIDHYRSGRTASKGAKITEKTMFSIGSISKMFTTAAVMMLVQEGKLSLDEPIVKKLPMFKMPDARYKNITVRMLLNHSSGLPGNCFKGKYTNARNRNHLKEEIEYAAQSRLKDQPGKFSVYCNDGFSLAELLVEVVSGQSYSSFIYEKILEPLGMEHTDFPIHEIMDGKYIKAKSPFDLDFPQEYVNGIGSGGIYSTAADLCHFLDALREGRLVDEAGLTEMNRDQQPKELVVAVNTTERYGLGWDCVSMRLFEGFGKQALCKSGSTFGFNSHSLIIPDCQLSAAVVLCTDKGSASKLNQALVYEILKAQGCAFEATPLPALKTVVHPVEITGLYGNKDQIVRARFEHGDLTLEIREAQGGWRPEVSGLQEDHGWFAGQPGTSVFGMADLKIGFVPQGDELYLVYQMPGSVVSEQAERQVFLQKLKPSGKVSGWKNLTDKTWIMDNEYLQQRTLGNVPMTFTVQMEKGYDDLLLAPYPLRILNDYEAVPAIEIPGNYSREMSSVLWLADGSIQNGQYHYVLSENLPSLDVREMTLRDPLIHWYIGAAPIDTLKIDGVARVVVLDENGQVEFDSQLSSCLPASLRGKRIGFFGELNSKISLQYLEENA